MLQTQGLTKNFGGLKAVDSVDFTLEDELCALIGPNGAGKTTFFNLLTGVLEPTAGTIEYQSDEGWVNITDNEPHETASRGIHRSYQVTNIFPTFSVLDNVRIAVQAPTTDTWRLWRNRNVFDEYKARAFEILQRVELTEYAEEDAKNLSHGDKRKLEIAIALAGDPAVLLLDEPTAGISSESLDAMITLIQDVAEEYPVLLVEHNMDLVMEVSDRIVVLNNGSLIADGPPTDIQDSERVQQAYLGGYEPKSRTEPNTEGQA